MNKLLLCDYLPNKIANINDFHYLFFYSLFREASCIYNFQKKFNNKGI